MDDDAKPAEFPKMLYRGGGPYNEHGGLNPHQDSVVVADAQMQADAEAEGFSVYEPPEPTGNVTDEMPRTAAPVAPAEGVDLDALDPREELPPEGAVLEPGVDPAVEDPGIPGATVDPGAPVVEPAAPEAV